MQAFVIGLWLAEMIPADPTCVAWDLDACERDLVFARIPTIQVGNESFVFRTSREKAAWVMYETDSACHPNAWPYQTFDLYWTRIVLHVALLLSVALKRFGALDTMTSALCVFFGARVYLPILQGFYVKDENVYMYPENVRLGAIVVYWGTYAVSAYREYVREETQEETKSEMEEPLLKV